MSWIGMLDQANRRSNDTIARGGLSRKAAQDADEGLVLYVSTAIYPGWVFLMSVFGCLLAREAINARAEPWWQRGLLWAGAAALLIGGAFIVTWLVVAWIRYLRRDNT